MSAVSVSWLRCYQQLQRLAQQLQLAQDSGQLHTCIRLASELNSELQQVFELQAGAAVAQLAILPADLALGPAQALKSWVLLALWSRLKHWPAARRDALAVSVLLAACSEEKDKAPAALRLASKLKKLQVGGLTTNLLAGSFHQLQQRRPWQVHHDSPLLTLALQLGQQLQPQRQKAQALDQVISQTQIQTTDEAVLAELNQLAQLAPHLYWCGRLAQDTVGRCWVICQLEVTDCLVLQYWPEQQRFATEAHKLAKQDLQLLAPSVMVPQHWLDRIQIPALSSRPLPTPKGLLEHSVLQKLDYQDLDAQVKLLEKQPLLAQYLLDNASTSNRKQTLVNRLRHALAMFGQDQLPLAVARAELLQYLQLQAFNQHAFLLALQDLFRHSLLLLGRYLSPTLSPQQAGVIAACCSAPFWHHPSISAVPISRSTNQGWLLPELAQQYLLEPVRSQRLSAALLQHYQLAHWAEAVLCQYVSIDHRNFSLREQHGLWLRLCWQLSFSILRYPQAQASSSSLLQSLSPVLNLPQQSLELWQQQLIAAASPVCPLD